MFHNNQKANEYETISPFGGVDDAFNGTWTRTNNFRARLVSQFAAVDVGGTSDSPHCFRETNVHGCHAGPMPDECGKHDQYC
jgi:hypothetical protein